MTHFILLALWTAFLTGWANVLYFHACGVSGKKPDYSITVKSLVIGIIALALGTVLHSFTQAALAAYARAGL